MKVKDLALTFVAMGGFAVPIQFQSTANANPAGPETAPTVLIGLSADEETRKGKEA